jgi:hypothetical protein
MRKFTLFFTLLCMVLGVSAQTNLVQNPSFESGFNGGWLKGFTSSYTDPTLVTTGAQDGTNYVQYIATATTGFYQNVPVTGGKSYLLSFWYKATGDNTDARLWSGFYDGATPPAFFYQTADPATDPLRSNNGYLPTATDWTKHQVSFTAPANAVTFQLAVRAYNGGTVSYDNFSLVEDQSANVNNTKVMLSVFAANGKINFEAAEGETVEVYNTVGQKVLSAAAISGNNTLTVNAKGVVFVKVGNRTGKVIL